MEFKLEKSRSVLVFLIISAILLAILSVYLYFEIGLGISVFFGFFSILSFYATLAIRRIEVNHGKISVHSHLNLVIKVYYPDDIISWQERTTKYGSLVTIFFKNGELKLEPLAYKNFDQFRSLVLNNKPQDIDYQKNYQLKTYRISSKFYLTVAAICFLIAVSLFFYSRFPLDKSKFTQISGMLLKDVSIEQNEDGRKLYFLVNTKVDKFFVLPIDDYKFLMSVNEIERIHVSDSLSFFVSTEDIKSDISPDPIVIKGISHEGNDLFNLADYNNYRQAQLRFNMYAALIFATAFLFLGLHYKRKG